MPQRGLPTNLDPAANAAFRTRDHKPFFGFCKPQLMRQGRQDSKGDRRQLRARSSSKRCHPGDRPAFQVDDPAPAAATGQPTAAATGPGSGGRDLPSFPAAWLVLVALAALAGAAAGTRLGGRAGRGSA